MEEVYFKANKELANHLIHNGYEENTHIDYPEHKSKRTFCLFRTPTKKRTKRTMLIKFDYINIWAFHGSTGFKNWTSISKTELYKLITFQKQEKHSSHEIHNYS